MKKLLKETISVKVPLWWVFITSALFGTILFAMVNLFAYPKSPPDKPNIQELRYILKVFDHYLEQEIQGENNENIHTRSGKD